MLSLSTATIGDQPPHQHRRSFRAITMASHLVAVALLLALVLASRPSAAQSRRWDGTAPICKGKCKPWERELGRASGSTGNHNFESPPFGSPCTISGTKALCETVMSPEQWAQNEEQRREQARRAEKARRAAESRERAEAPLRPIADTILRDRQRGCADVNSGAFSRDPRLDEVAQRYARAEKEHPAPQLNGYGASIVAYLGTGDPQAQAINYAYKKGAGQAIGNCALKRFGVGFFRIDQRSVDFVAIVLGTPQ